tara:strand:+ start:2779 stop:2997 length:219 start_codon:yes stop_codon:yes gene_type:complete
MLKAKCFTCVWELWDDGETVQTIASSHLQDCLGPIFSSDPKKFRDQIADMDFPRGCEPIMFYAPRKSVVWLI